MKILNKLIDSKYKIVEITFHFKNFKKKGYDIMLLDRVLFTIEPTFRNTDKYMLYGCSISTTYFKNIHQVVNHILNT